MSIKKKMLQAAAGNAGGGLDIADVFSTDLYAGNSSTQTITNGIDLDGEGGLVWIKSRSTAYNHYLIDSERGITQKLNSDSTGAQAAQSDISSFNSDGFSLSHYWGGQNFSGHTFATWTFRKAPKFFDVVTYTGNGVAGREIAHNLGQEVGMILVKRTSSSEAWFVLHRSLGADNRLSLNFEYAASDEGNVPGAQTWYDTPTDSGFYVGSTNRNNGSGSTYVAYIFAHDTEDDNVIQCGSYTGNGGTEQDVDLGWEPQFLLVKNASSAADWWLTDSARGFTTVGINSPALYPNKADAETTQALWNSNATGFTVGAFNNVNGNASGDNYIYMAIRGPMMKEPESATEVFTTAYPTSSTAPNYVSDFAPDFTIRHRRSSAYGHITNTRLTGSSEFLRTETTAAAATGYTSNAWDQGKGYGSGFGVNTDFPLSMWKRAKGYFDVVTYTGDGTTDSQRLHSLGVAPEMIWVKVRSQVGDWIVGHSGLTPLSFNELVLNTNGDVGSKDNNNEVSKATNTYITVNSNSNSPSQTYIAYLFASLAGISKVGSYTGNGSSQTLDCGFTSGARFILIKRADVDGDWYIWDSVRGIVAGNDPHLSPNTTAVEVTTNDSVDPDSSGFTVNQVAATNINVSAATYIFYAIA